MVQVLGGMIWVRYGGLGVQEWVYHGFAYIAGLQKVPALPTESLNWRGLACVACGLPSE